MREKLPSMSLDGVHGKVGFDSNDSTSCDAGWIYERPSCLSEVSDGDDASLLPSSASHCPTCFRGRCKHGRYESSPIYTPSLQLHIEP